MNIFPSVLPIVILVAIGWLTVRTGYIRRERWEGVEVLSFRLLIPAIIFSEIIHSELHAPKLARFVLVACGAIVVMFLLGLLSRHLVPKSRLGNPEFTSVLQLSIRWNAFVPLAIAASMTQEEWLGLIAVVMAFTIPLINLLLIPALAVYGTSQTSVARLLKNILTNPLVVSSLLALGINLANIPIPSALDQAISLTGRAALAVGILCIGASIELRRLALISMQAAVGILNKLILLPLIFWGIASVAGLNDTQILVGILVMGAPAATNGYVVAKNMGGNAEVYAVGLTWQTLLCALSIPILLSLATQT